MLTVLEIIKRTTDFLAGKGVESARHNAETLVGHALSLPRMQLYLQFERPLTEQELERIRPLVRRRGQREPLQYIVGECDFFGLRLRVDRRALIPRPETELLVEQVTTACPVPPGVILDLGTGTGAMALALARHFPEARVTAVDLSEAALDLARENELVLGMAGRVNWVRSDWFQEVDRALAFDLIVANPPYLSDVETDSTAPEVRQHEPRSALSSGPDGLEALRIICGGALKHLAQGGLLALETGIDQHSTLAELLRTAGFATVESRQDLTKRDRFIFARR